MTQERDLSRRRLLHFVAASSGSLLLSCKTTSNQSDVDSLLDSRVVFPLGIASGDPLTDAVVLWTKIGEDAYRPGQKLLVELSKDTEFSTSFTRELQDKSAEFGPDRDLTAAIDVTGLEPFTTYFYRFRYGRNTSPVGRCKTLAEENQVLDRARLAVLTCHDYTTGYFNALSHLADQTEIDLVVQLGDFVYEYDAYPEFGNSIIRRIGLTNGSNFALSLEDFRRIYRTYRSDPHLQRAMSAHPWIIVWDDHEVGDNSFHDYARQSGGLGFYAPDPHPYALTAADQKLAPEALQEKLKVLAEHKRAAMQAWLEYVPARWKMVKVPGQDFEFVQMYRSFRMGQFLEIFLTDSRSFRTEAPCAWKSSTTCYDYLNEASYAEDTGKATENSMLGGTQSRWLVEGLQLSPCTWKVWANQTLLGQLALTGPITGRALVFANYDAWDGYQSERTRVLNDLSKLDNFVVLTGDFHTVLASEVKTDYRGKRGEVIGFEFMTPSLTSPNFQDAIKAKASWVPQGIAARTILSTNEHLKHFSMDIYGYSVLDMKRENGKDIADWTVYHIDKLTQLPAQLGAVKHDLLKSRAFRYDPVSKKLQEARLV